jgi:Mg-chelatase subunit ChlD
MISPSKQGGQPPPYGIATEEGIFMNKNLTELIFILDRSGSMSGLEADTIGGYNSLLAKQREGEGDVLVSTLLFDDRTELVHDRVSIAKVEELTNREYYVRGSTALLDAIGGAIHHMGNVHRYAREEDKPARTLMVITTDGMENASTRYRLTEVREMIRRQREKYGWEFLFLGANIDAMEEAERMGIGRDYAVRSMGDSVGVSLNYHVACEAVSDIRTGKGIKGDWKAAIEEDFKTRGK